MTGNTADTTDKASTHLNRKVNKILSTQLENDKDTVEALKELSAFFPKNSLQSRRNLLGQIERRSLHINQDFVSAFRDVKDALDSIYGDIVNMNSVCEEMSSKLKITKNQTNHLIEQTAKLQGESQKLSMKHDVAVAFVANFQLTTSEQEILRGGHDNTITLEFFTVLQKVQKIHQDCQLILQLGHQTAALDIMEQMALYQETALERLYRWTQSQCKNVEFPEISTLLANAMACLQDRPVLFKYVLDEYCTARRSVVVRAFIDALTIGGVGGMPKPIESHSDDPIRYIGDMLAWLHQAIPTEKENIQSLIKNCDNTESTSSASGTLGNVIEGVCRPLCVRIEHVIAAERNPVTLYKLTNLMRFYQGTINQAIPNSTLASTLSDLVEQSCKSFLVSLKNSVSGHVQQGVVPSNDLTPVGGVGSVMTMLQEVLSGGSVVQNHPQDLDQIIPILLDPLLQAITDNVAHLTSTDMAVFRLNCLYQMHSTLSLYEYMETHLQRLSAEIEAELNVLTSEQASWLEAHLGLGAICSVLRESKEPLSTVPGMDDENLGIFVAKLDSYFHMPEALLLPQSRFLQSSMQRRVLLGRAAEVVVAVYRQLYEAVRDPHNAYNNPDTLLRRTPEEVQKMVL